MEGLTCGDISDVQGNQGWGFLWMHGAVNASKEVNIANPLKHRDDETSTE